MYKNVFLEEEVTKREEFFMREFRLIMAFPNTLYQKLAVLVQQQFFKRSR